jgi:hypothetical protein
MEFKATVIEFKAKRRNLKLQQWIRKQSWVKFCITNGSPVYTMNNTVKINSVALTGTFDRRNYK